MKTNIIQAKGFFKNQSYFIGRTCFSNSKIDDSELLIFFQSVCEFFNIYDNVVTCLESSIHSITTKKEELMLVVNSIKKGVLFSNALEKSNLVSKTIINIIRAGEKNNDLIGSFRLVVEFLNNNKTQKNKLKNALFYPVFTFFAFFLTIFTFSRFVIPSLVELVYELNVDLFNRFFWVEKILYVLEFFFFAITSVFIFIYFLYRYDSDYFEKLCLKISLLKNLFIYSSLYFVSYYMEISLKNGLAVEEALDVTISSSNNSFKKILKNVKQEVLKGKELSFGFRRHSLIPKLFSDIISSGEKSNNLVSSFETAGVIFKNQQQNFIDKTIMFLPVFLITFIAILLIFFVSFLLFPLYNLGI